jgi:hypothetical protein
VRGEAGIACASDFKWKNVALIGVVDFYLWPVCLGIGDVWCAQYKKPQKQRIQMFEWLGVRFDHEE